MSSSPTALVATRNVRHKEKKRTECINNAFSELRRCIPNVPSDTKLSKIKTLRLASSYISHLSDILENYDPEDKRDGKEFHAELQVLKARERQKNFRLLLSHKGKTSAGQDDKSNCLDGRCFDGEPEVRRRGRTGWPEAVWAEALECKRSSDRCRTTDYMLEDIGRQMTCPAYQQYSPQLPIPYWHYVSSPSPFADDDELPLSQANGRCVSMLPITNRTSHAPALVATDLNVPHPCHNSFPLVPSMTETFTPSVLSAVLATPTDQSQCASYYGLSPDKSPGAKEFSEASPGKLPSISTLRAGDKFQNGRNAQAANTNQIKMAPNKCGFYSDLNTASSHNSPRLIELQPVTFNANDRTS